MAYYTAVYTKSNHNWFTNENQIWEHHGFTVHQVGGTYYMLKDGYRIAELLEIDRLHTAYGGSFIRWIAAIRKKDIKKIEKLREYQEQISKDIELIESIWK